MMEGQDVMERSNSPTFCLRSTNKGSFSTDMYGCIYHCLVSDTFFAKHFFQNCVQTTTHHVANSCRSQITSGPQTSLRNNALRSAPWSEIHHWQTILNTVQFHVLTAASMKMTVFRDIVPCSPAEVNRRFRGTYCLQHHHVDDGGSKHLWNVSQLLPDYMVLYPRKPS
jgi:hypothetical protein